MVNKSLLEPESIFASIIMQMTYFVYPLVFIRSISKPGRTLTILFAPLAAIASVGMLAGIQYTALDTFADLLHNIWKPDVMFRLFAVTMMLVYSFALFLVLPHQTPLVYFVLWETDKNNFELGIISQL